MKLGQARREFSECLVVLCQYILKSGKKFAFDEVTERLTEKDKQSDHRKGSCHHVGLAADLNLYTHDGIYLDQTEHHRKFGEFWEKLHPLARWGGRWGDGNHYSYEWEGRK